MRSVVVRLTLAAATLAVAFSVPASAELLGCRKVGFGVDRDVIPVGRADGRFGAIQLRVSDNAIDILDLKVVYGNGAPDDLPVRSLIAAGGETRWIDLRGARRFIREVQLTYRSIPNFRGQATVCVHGR